MQGKGTDEHSPSSQHDVRCLDLSPCLHPFSSPDVVAVGQGLAVGLEGSKHNNPGPDSSENHSGRVLPKRPGVLTECSRNSGLFGV